MWLALRFVLPATNSNLKKEKRFLWPLRIIYDFWIYQVNVCNRASICLVCFAVWQIEDIHRRGPKYMFRVAEIYYYSISISGSPARGKQVVIADENEHS